MRRPNTRSRLSSLALTGIVTAAGVFLSAGCAKIDLELVIVQSQAPDTSKAGVCTLTAKRSDTIITQGSLDVALDAPHPYTLYPLVTNLLPEFKGDNPNTVTLTGFDIQIVAPPGVTFPDTAACPSHHVFHVGGQTLQPLDEVATTVDILRECHAAEMADLFNAGVLPKDVNKQVFFQTKIRALGKHGGGDIQSDEFTFPVRICYGCFQKGFALPDYTRYNVNSHPACSQLPSTGLNPYLGNPCGFWQDGDKFGGPVLCCHPMPISTNDPGPLECPGSYHAP